MCMYSQDQCTPLYVASARGFNDVVKTLLVANANVNCICKVSCRSVLATVYKYLASNTLKLHDFASYVCSHLLSCL